MDAHAGLTASAGGIISMDKACSESSLRDSTASYSCEHFNIKPTAAQRTGVWPSYSLLTILLDLLRYTLTAPENQHALGM